MTPHLRNFEFFMHWIIERENIRLRKEAGHPKPWSEDWVFQQTYFCNVHREHDKVTRWIRQNYSIDDEAGHAEFNMVMARMVNKPDTLDRLYWPWSTLGPTNHNRWMAIMSQPGAWGSAYIVSTNGRKQAKHEYIWDVLRAARAHLQGLPPAALQGTLQGAHSALQGVSGLGSFMAAQVVADLKNTPGHPLVYAEDWKTFAAHGPGSLRGLSWFFDQKITPSMFTDALHQARQYCIDSAMGNYMEGICNQDLQNCFCEYDKYMRVKNGTGRSKRKYNGQ